MEIRHVVGHHRHPPHARTVSIPDMPRLAEEDDHDGQDGQPEEERPHCAPVPAGPAESPPGDEEDDEVQERQGDAGPWVHSSAVPIRPGEGTALTAATANAGDGVSSVTNRTPHFVSL